MSDSISRLDVLEEINRIGVKAFTDYANYSNFFDFVSELPKSEERPTGRWIPARGTYYCSCCKHFAYESQRFNFCQDCGADMRVKHELGDRE